MDELDTQQTAYFNRLRAMTDDELYVEYREVMTLSRLHWNTESDFHWMLTGAYDECFYRGRQDFFERATNATNP